MTLDRWFKPRGPRGICGGPDARHRLGDSIYGQWRAGDDTSALFSWFGIKHRAIVAVLVEYELARRQHRRRPFQESV